MLSIAIKAADTFSVGPGWQPEFADVAIPPYLLHKACSISELTVCLDQRDADGKITSYQVRRREFPSPLTLAPPAAS